MLNRHRVSILLLTLAFAVVTHSTATASRANGSWTDAYRDAAGRLIGEAMSGTFAWDRLALLGDTFGNRLSGSKALEDAIEWAVDEMKKDGLENVHAEPVKVPYWIRGRESAEITSPRQRSLVMLGLGNSIGTPPDGVEAEVLVVRSFEELDANAARANGRIVLYDVPFTTYGETVQFRTNGPSRAAALGAVATLVRSVGPPGLRLPHTGALRYADGVAQIPGAAITTEDADLLQRMQERGTPARVRLRMEAKFLPDADSFNVVGELRGRERPDEVVVIGGHLDSWDVGTGSTDDGGGCVVTWEALRIMKKLNLRPRRTVRVVLWTNEENGTRGAVAYRDRHKDQLAQHVLMLESDDGLLRPAGF
jgi:carboxypeptidase Q